MLGTTLFIQSLSSEVVRLYKERSEAITGEESGEKKMGNLRSCTLVLVLVFWLCSGIVIGRRTTSTLAAADTIGSFQHSTDALDSQTRLDPNSMSKRRVPNGPDPIHNRRAGKSARPPGRV